MKNNYYIIIAVSLIIIGILLALFPILYIIYVKQGLLFSSFILGILCIFIGCIIGAIIDDRN